MTVKNQQHPNAVPGRTAQIIDTLAGGTQLVGHVVNQPLLAPLIYVDIDMNLSVNLLRAREQPEAIRTKLDEALRELGISHPAPEVLVDSIRAAAAACNNK